VSAISFPSVRLYDVHPLPPFSLLSLDIPFPKSYPKKTGVKISSEVGLKGRPVWPPSTAIEGGPFIFSSLLSLYGILKPRSSEILLSEVRKALMYDTFPSPIPL